MNQALQVPRISQAGGRRTPPPSFYRTVFSEIEEVGWEHLISSQEDLSSLSFRVLDSKGRAHILEITLPPNYPGCSPSIAADVPYICHLHWTRNSRLKDVMGQFTEHLQKLQEFWSTLDDIDRSLYVVNPKQISYAASYRQISLGNDCYLLLSLDAHNPSSVPECRFLGPDSRVEQLTNKWRKNSRKWKQEKSFHENLEAVLEIYSLPRPPTVHSTDDEQVDCGICYSLYLPVDNELGVSSGSAPDYTCDNPSCRKAFHIVCLRDWLHTITTTRQSFDTLFGNCPYCSEPVAVKVNACR